MNNVNIISTGKDKNYEINGSFLENKNAVNFLVAKTSKMNLYSCSCTRIRICECRLL